MAINDALHAFEESAVNHENCGGDEFATEIQVDVNTNKESGKDSPLCNDAVTSVQTEGGADDKRKELQDIASFWTLSKGFLSSIAEQFNANDSELGFYQQDSFEEDIDEVDCSREEKEKLRSLFPWEQMDVRTGDIKTHEELRTMVLDLSKNESNFREVSLELKTRPEFQVDFLRFVDMLKKLMTVDKNLSMMHAKLAGRKLPEDQFWNNYLIHLKVLSIQYFASHCDNDESPRPLKNLFNCRGGGGWVNLRDKALLNEVKGIVVSSHGTICYEDFVVV